VRIGTRFVLFGAALPLIALSASITIGGVLFRRSLEAGVDRALLAQAASESVSMFDSPGGEPHLHIEHAALPVEVIARAPQAAVIDANGRVVMSFPEGVAMPAVPSPSGADPELATVGKLRVLSVRVGQRGRVYTLRLWTDLEHVDLALRRYWQVTMGSAAVLGAALLALQLWHARRLGRRIDRLRAWLPKVRDEGGEWSPPRDEGADELTELRDGLDEAMQRVRRMREAEERLVANAAHELRTPLGAMRMELDLALRRDRSADELREALTSARDEVDRLARLSSRLLDLADAHGGALELDRIDLDELVSDAVDAATSALEARSLSVRRERRGDTVIEADALRLRQVVDNLLGNAIRFAPRGSEVRIELDAEAEPVRLAVVDAGPGVPEGAESRIFEPFHRESKGDAGAGLGLAISQQVAQRHGGSVSLAKNVPGEVRFELTLPRRPPGGGRRSERRDVDPERGLRV
jgi:signal transduction histidine kinase